MTQCFDTQSSLFFKGDDHREDRITMIAPDEDTPDEDTPD